MKDKKEEIKNKEMNIEKNKNKKNIFQKVGVGLLILLLCVLFVFALTCDSYSQVKYLDVTNLTLDEEKVELKDDNILKIKTGGKYEITGENENLQIKIDTEKRVELILNNVTLTCLNGSCINVKNAKLATITLKEESVNTLTDSQTYDDSDSDAALFSNDDLIIQGEGKLIVNGNYKHGIASDDALTIKSGEIVVNSYEHAIKANEDITIDGGTLDLTSQTGKGIKAKGNLTINDGNINAVSEKSEGIETKKFMTINGGIINVDAYDDGLNAADSSNTNGFRNMDFDFDKEDINDFVDNLTKNMSDEDKEKVNNVVEKLEESNYDLSTINVDELPDSLKNMIPQMPGENENGDAFEMKNMPDMMQMKQDGNAENANMQNAENQSVKPSDDKMQNKDMTKFEEMTDEEKTAMKEKRDNGNGGGGFMMANDNNKITINGGIITIKTSGDGMDSNGDLVINGGTIIVDGPARGGNGPLDCDGTMYINGGDVITMSCNSMLQFPSDSKQNNVLVYLSETINANSNVVIKEKDTENEIISVTSKLTFTALYINSSKLELNKTYEVYIDGTLKETFTKDDVSTKVGTMTKSSSSFGFSQGGMGHGNRGEKTQKQTNDQTQINSK